jgi:hypothetical protein
LEPLGDLGRRVGNDLKQMFSAASDVGSPHLGSAQSPRLECLLGQTDGDDG